MQTAQKWYQEIAKPDPPNTNTIWSCTFNIDGSLLFVVISDILVVYNAENGDVITKPTKAAKDVINCIAFAKDGKTFATASNDKSCVLWRYNADAQKKIEPLLKFSQGEPIITLAFNPLTHQLFSGGASDFALYTPGKQDIPKQKYKQKILCSAWSPDGQTLAFGTMGGTISFRQRNLDQKNQIKKPAAIWCMQWTPITSDHQQSYLLVGCWDRTFYYFNSQGQIRQKIAQKRIPFNPISLNFHSSGQFFLVSGTNKKISIFTRDLGFLSDLVQLKDWSWCSKFRPKSMELVVTTNDGLISLQSLSKKPIFSNYQQIFATRDNLTDIIIQNLILNQKLRIKCKQLVKKISIFKDKLAVLQNQRLLIYISSEQSLKYNPFRKITKQFQCQFMSVLNSHIIFAKDTKIQLFNLIGQLQKQWILQSQITYLKALGGPPKRQHFVVGLKNGQIFKIFLDNSFPILLYKSSASIRCCDLNLNKKKLALVDTNNNLLVIDLITQAQLYQQMGIISCIWNSDLQDTLAYSGGNMLSIRTGNMPALTQRTQANVLGFKGFQIFIIKQDKISIMDVSQSSTLIKFIQKKDFKMAYKLACLGVTQNDIKMLGIEALQNMDFDIATKCFVRLKDLPFIQLTKKYADDAKLGKLKQNQLKAQVLAYQGKYQQAANTYIKASLPDQAMRLFSQLKRFEEAQRFLRINKSEDTQSKAIMSNILSQQAQWAKQNGDWKTAANLYISSRNYKKAIDLYSKENYLEGLIQVCRMIDKADNQSNLIICANIFRKNKNHSFAKQAYLKLGDVENLMALHVEMQRWEQAFLIGRQNKQLLQIAKLPYANYLMKVDKYEQALRAFKNLGRFDLTNKMLITLANNAVSQKRFVDAGRHFWTMALEQIKFINDLKNITKQQQNLLNKYNQLRTVAQIYYVFNSINTFVESPFFTSSQSALYTILNACRFLISKIGTKKLPYINLTYIYFSLAKVSKLLQGYKTARSCYQKLTQLKVPNKWNDQIDLGSLLVRSKPYSDKQTILPICNRCFMANPVISEKDSCFSCKHPFIMSFVSFQILPLVQFKIQNGISHSKLIQLLNTQKVNKKGGKKNKKDDGWNQSKNEKHQILSFKLNKGTQQIQNTPFYQKMSQTVDQQQTNTQYVPIVLNAEIISTLDSQSIYVLDMRKQNPSAEIKYYRNLVPDLLLKCCNQCGKFFLLDEYQFEYIHTKRCPFCNVMDKRAGNSKDIFQV